MKFRDHQSPGTVTRHRRERLVDVVDARGLAGALSELRNEERLGQANATAGGCHRRCWQIDGARPAAAELRNDAWRDQLRSASLRHDGRKGFVDALRNRIAVLGNDEVLQPELVEACLDPREGLRGQRLLPLIYRRAGQIPVDDVTRRRPASGRHQVRQLRMRRVGPHDLALPTDRLDEQPRPRRGVAVIRSAKEPVVGLVAERLESFEPCLERRALLAGDRSARGRADRPPPLPFGNVLDQDDRRHQGLRPAQDVPRRGPALVIHRLPAAGNAVMRAFRRGPQEIKLPVPEEILGIDGVDAGAEVPHPRVVLRVGGNRHVPVVHGRQMHRLAKSFHGFDGTGGRTPGSAEQVRDFEVARDQATLPSSPPYSRTMERAVDSVAGFSQA